MNRGYARVRRIWQRGDKVTLDLPMPVERVHADDTSFAEVARRKWTVAAVTGIKLGVMPPLMWFIAWALGGDSLAQGIALICGAAPGSAASYILARQMGGDAPLIAGVIALTTVGSAVVIPILLALFHFT